MTAAPAIIRASSSGRSSSRRRSTAVMRPTAAHGLDHAEVGRTGRRDLREMRDAQHLRVPAQLAELPPHIVGGTTADAGVHLVEDERRRASGGAGEAAERQHHAGELSSGRDPGQRPQFLTWIRRDEELGLIGPARPSRRPPPPLPVESERRSACVPSRARPGSPRAPTRTCRPPSAVRPRARPPAVR